MTWLVVNELTEDPTDMLGSALRRVAESLSLDTHDFFAIYLGAHGLIKLFIIVSLARGLRWAFPTGIVVLGAFVLYQSYHFVIGPSVILFAITSFDMFVIALIWREYRAMPKLDEVAA